MRSEILKDWDSVSRLKKDWDQLLRKSEGNSIFLRWDWIDSWSKVHERKPKPYVIVAYGQNGDIIGLAPFYLNTMKLIGSVAYKTLNIMAYHATGSEYPDIIVKKENRKEAIQTIAGELEKQQKDWDCLWLPRVATWTGADSRFKELSKEGHFIYHDREQEFSKVDLPENIDQFYKMLSKNMRSQLKRQRNKLLKNEEIEFIQCREKDKLGEYLDVLFKLHNKRWKSAGIEGTFKKKPEEAAFYRTFAYAALENNWLWLFGVRHKGNIVAVQIGYVYNGTFNQLQEGFDPDFGDGIGNILRIYVVEECMKSGVKEYDFLGGYTEHKRRWGAEKRIGKDVYIANRKLKNRLLMAGPFWPSGRYLCDCHG